MDPESERLAAAFVTDHLRAGWRFRWVTDPPPTAGADADRFEAAAPGAGPTPYDFTRLGDLVRAFLAGRGVEATDQRVFEVVVAVWNDSRCQ